MWSTTPMVIRSGKVYQTADDPDAPSKWVDPDKVTKAFEDDDDRTAIALFVVDEMPLESVKKVIDDNLEGNQHPILWLADSYDTIPDFDFHPLTPGVEGTDSDELDNDWHSPFIGSSLKDCVEFMRSAPRPPKGLNTKYCAVLQKDLYENYGCVLICKAMGRNDAQTIPCSADKIGLFYTGFTRQHWRENYRMQALY